MRALLFIKIRGFINAVKKRLKKTLTYVYGALIAAYCFFMLGTFGDMFSGMGLDSPEGLTMILSGLVFFTLPTNLLTYVKRKGLIFLKSDIHFVFPTPISPKKILLYAQLRQFLASGIFSLLFMAGAIAWFHISVITMLLYFFLSFIVESCLEYALVVLIYGNESFKQAGAKLLRGALLITLGLLVVFGIYLYINVEPSMGVIQVFLEHPLIQCVPVIGWNIAFIRLLLLGPDTVNVICTILYLLSTCILCFSAYRMKCTGEYFEEAMEFAEDYAVQVSNQKKGIVVLNNKKKKYKEASITYKGFYAKAIFYRQILEYKKNRFFILGWNSLLSLAIGVGIGIFAYTTDIPSDVAIFIIPGISAYIALIFSGYATKWSRELSNPYTFMLPDRAIKKLWYATLVEHIRSLIDGCLIAVPAGIMLGLTPLQILLSVLIYACIKAVNLYCTVICDSIISKLFGSFGMSMVKFTIEGIVLIIGIVLAVLGSQSFSIEAAFMILIFYTIVITIGLAFFASISFNRMESLD